MEIKDGCPFCKNPELETGYGSKDKHYEITFIDKDGVRKKFYSRCGI